MKYKMKCCIQVYYEMRPSQKHRGFAREDIVQINIIYIIFFLRFIFKTNFIPGAAGPVSLVEATEFHVKV